MFSNNIKPKLSFNFWCEICDYGTCKKSNYTNHVRSAKHLKSMFSNEKQQKISSKFVCDNCSKEYKDNSGLWRHKKKCIKMDEKTDDSEYVETIHIKDKDKDALALANNELTDKELIFTSLREILKQNSELIKENSEFKQLMLEQNKQMIELAKNSGNNNHNTTNNNNNNNFNLNFFLNETCKNAMNIMDFVAQLQVGIKELEDTGRLGFSEGISKIFINGLKQMDVSDRPIHCSDSKREVVYIKDKDQWNKETEDKTILTNAIKHVAHKNMKQISEWTKGHPEFNDSTSKQNDRYLNIVCESMSGSSQEETNKNYNKIIKNIVKETIIDK
jgi:hypothetical protein